MSLIEFSCSRGYESLRPCTWRTVLEAILTILTIPYALLWVQTKREKKILYSMIKKTEDIYLVSNVFHLQIVSMTSKALLIKVLSV